MTGESYERWVGGYCAESGGTMGQLRSDAKVLRFVEVVVNGPKTWSLTAALHPEIDDAITIPDLHQLRHTAASLAIASGADAKVVQQMLGHASATMTLGTNGHLFEDRLDEVGSAMDAAR